MTDIFSPFLPLLNPFLLSQMTISDFWTGFKPPGWNEIAQGPTAHFPLEVARVGTSVDVRLAEASLQSDRHAIMNFIALGPTGLRASNPPPVKHVAYDKLNELLGFW